MDQTEEILISLINYYNSNYLYINSLYYSERYYYNKPSSLSLYYLSKSYYNLNKYKQVYHLLKEDKNNLNCYLFSIVCIKLNKLNEAENCLLSNIKNIKNINDINDKNIQLIPGGSNGLYLLGLICKKEQRKEYAINYFKKCLEFDNMCWAAFTELCEMGVNLDIDKIYDGMSLQIATDIMKQATSQFSTVSEDWKSLNSKQLNNNKSNNNSNSNNNNNIDDYNLKGNSARSIMERRKTVEQIRDSRASPHAATSLGLSSCTLRIGFATPGCMPSPSQSMTPINKGDGSLLSNTQFSAPYSAYHPIQSDTPSDLQHNTPLQLPTNPLQFLLQSRHHNNNDNDDNDDNNNDVVNDDNDTNTNTNTMINSRNEVSRIGGISNIGGISGPRTSTSIGIGFNHEDETSDSFTQTPAPAPQITKHLFPSTNEIHQTNKNSNKNDKQINISDIGGSDISRISGSIQRDIRGKSNQLFDTPGSQVEFDDTIAHERNIDDDLLDMSSSVIGTHREITIKGMATPGLTPIERRDYNNNLNNLNNKKISNDNDDNDDNDDNGDVEGNDDILIYGGRSTVRKITNEKSGFLIDDKDDKLFTTREFDRDEVRRRVSFGPMIETREDFYNDSRIDERIEIDDIEEEEEDSDLMSSGSGFPPSKIPRRLRGDTSRSISPPTTTTTTTTTTMSSSTPHSKLTQPPVMRGRKKSIERDHLTSPSSSSRYNPTNISTQSLNTSPHRTTTRQATRSQRSISPQPTSTTSSSTITRRSVSPVPIDSLSSHSYNPSSRVQNTSNLSPTRQLRSSRSPTRSMSPPAPVIKNRTKSTSGQQQQQSTISPVRSRSSTSTTIPQTPSSANKTIGGSRVLSQSKVSKDQKNQNNLKNPQAPIYPEISNKIKELTFKNENISNTNNNLNNDNLNNNNNNNNIKNEQSKNVNTNNIDPEKYVLSLIVICSHIKYLLCQYRCHECISVCQLLPRRHYSSGWVQHMIGKAYFELNDYKSSQLALREMLRLEPFRVTGTELLSTCLWHLKKDKELCSLAQQVIEMDKFSPESWCVVGNSFSLRREHETAVKFFERALQLDRSFVYAHTLCGHEYICNEDLEKALQSFREGIYHDDRHYNAWYGIGTIYYRQERLELAEYHFKKAIEINPNSSVLICYLGMVLNAYNRSEKTIESIELLREACANDKKNPQLHFQYAHVLYTNGSYNCLVEALSVLYIVKEYASKESPVYSLLGQIYHRLGKNQEALKYFNYAIELDPKQAVLLKPTLDLIQEPYLLATSEEIQNLLDEI